MIVLNLLSRLFGRGDKLTREKIDQYQSTPQEQQSIEESVANQPFEDEALDGWRASGLSTESMRNLDKKMGRNYFGGSHWLAYSSFLVLIIVGGIGLFTFYTPATESDAHLTFSTTTTLTTADERSDVEITPYIEQMDEIEAFEQVQPEQLIQKYAQREQIKQSEKELAQTVDDPTINPIDPLPIPKETVIRPTEINKRLAFTFADEVYLSELKLVDYRSYRMGTVKTERMQYSGTPANLNYPDVTTKEDVIWKEVEIPYHEYLEKTMTLFSQHKFKQALQRFETILTTYPTDMNANFYSALCLYNLGQYPKSLERLMKSYSVEFGNFYEEALWYIAQTHEKMRNTHQAKEMYARIEREGGFYAIEAGKKK